ncbi:hypothetical protein DYE50_02640 [Treponema ruminis]|uniref:ATP-dependent Lon protease n=1 Tax=Treponema ruminis TaxID=744515 RepID=A0A7W8GAX5_9SPIR|nr:hypothetical protein [Treponema ruminis]MBB5227051.1 ATP-dependent Lon protease [Treponema ruminis]QSI01477.1 hypothetical protein DYE50_02640 [Treponema ruminis]
MNSTLENKREVIKDYLSKFDTIAENKSKNKFFKNFEIEKSIEKLTNKKVRDYYLNEAIKIHRALHGKKYYIDKFRLEKDYSNLLVLPLNNGRQSNGKFWYEAMIEKIL